MEMSEIKRIRVNWDADGTFVNGPIPVMAALRMLCLQPRIFSPSGMPYRVTEESNYERWTAFDSRHSKRKVLPSSLEAARQLNAMATEMDIKITQGITTGRDDRLYRLTMAAFEEAGAFEFIDGIRMNDGRGSVQSKVDHHYSDLLQTDEYDLVVSIDDDMEASISHAVLGKRNLAYLLTHRGNGQSLINWGYGRLPNNVVPVGSPLNAVAHLRNFLLERT